MYNLNYYENVTEENLDIEIKIKIKNNPKISTKEMAESLGMSARTIKRHIKTLVDVVYVGIGYSRHFSILPYILNYYGIASMKKKRT